MVNAREMKLADN